MKRAKRTVRATHDEILRIQKGFKASEPHVLPEGIQALPAGLFPRQLEPRVPPVKRSGLNRDGRGGGDGVILTSHGKPPISSTMPLGVFL